MFRLGLRCIPKSAWGPLGGAIGVAGGFLVGRNPGTPCCEPNPFLDTITGFFSSKSQCVDKVAPLVIAGPSGCGKGTLIQMLFNEYPDKFSFSVSSTTRKPRPGEVDGKDYHFESKENMEKRIQAGDFIEHAHVHSNYYGTSRQALEDVRNAGKIAVLDIDIQGAMQLKSKLHSAHYVFLAPPSMDVLEERLRGRGTETEEKIQVRLKNAVKEVEFSKEPGFWDIVIVTDNGNKTAFPTIKKHLEEWHPGLRA